MMASLLSSSFISCSLKPSSVPHLGETPRTCDDSAATVVMMITREVAPAFALAALAALAVLVVLAAFVVVLAALVVVLAAFVLAVVLVLVVVVLLLMHLVH